MSEANLVARCSACGREAPREEMFGLEPDLLCDRCAQRVRERLRPSAPGRLANVFAGGPTPVTAILLGAAIALFAIQNLENPVPRWLGLLLPYGRTGDIATGQAWRLVSSALLHGGFLHILFDGMWFWALGRAVEGTRGSGAFLWIFVASATFSSAAQWYALPGGGIGLSGVLYALAGYLWMRRRVDAVAASAMNPSTARMLGAWLVICFVLPMNIGNWAHTGGLAWGLGAGWLSHQRPAVRWPGTAVLALATLAAAYWVSTGHSVRGMVA